MLYSGMQKTLILWLFTALVFVLFAVLNAMPVGVNMLFGTVQVSLAVIIVFPLFLGATAGYTLDLFSRRKNGKRMKELEKKLALAETEIADLKAKLIPERTESLPAETRPAPPPPAL